MGKAVAVVKKAKAPKAPKAPKKQDRVAHWKQEICDMWQAAVESIISTGEQLIEAKEDLKGQKGAWGKLCDELPFGERTAQRLMEIARDPRLTDTTHVSVLPPSWGTLYELTKLDDKTFKAAMAKGTIHPGMERKDVETLLEKSKPKIDPEAEDADVVENEDEPDEEVEVEEDEAEVEDEDDEGADEPSNERSKETMGHVAPRLSRHDKKVDFVAGAIEVLAQRLGEFEEMLDSSQEVRDSMKSKMSRDMLKRAQEVSLIIDRLTKKYLKG